MSKIGLIGGTGPESTLIYYKELVYGVHHKANTAYFPNLVIESLSVFDVLKYCEDKNYEGLIAYLIQGIQNLAAAGAEYAALTGITPHIVFEQLQELSPIPLVSIIDAARDYACSCGYKRLALLGTYPTMTGDFFQKSFLKSGIDIVTPNREEMEYIGEKIESELELGVISPDTQERFKNIIERMIRDETIDGVVLGCTELPLIFRGIAVQVPYIDVMTVHINKLVDIAIM